MRLTFVFVLVIVLSSPLFVQAQARDFGDSDPVDFQPYGPDRFAIHGIDVARFQGEIDWRTARKAGVKFAFIKATEGGDWLDPRFKSNWRAAKQAGVRRGAYHFYYFCTAPRKQAKWFIRNVPRDKTALPPVLDMEWNPFSSTCKRRPSARTVRTEMKIFLDRVERRYGQRPIIYTTPEFFRQNDLGKLKGEEFWLRAVAQPPSQVYPGQNWTFWQYSGTGKVPGIKGKVDLNAFSGNASQWRSWLKRRARR